MAMTETTTAIISPAPSPIQQPVGLKRMHCLQLLWTICTPSLPALNAPSKYPYFNGVAIIPFMSPETGNADLANTMWSVKASQGFQACRETPCWFLHSFMSPEIVFHPENASVSDKCIRQGFSDKYGVDPSTEEKIWWVLLLIVLSCSLSRWWTQTSN